MARQADPGRGRLRRRRQTAGDRSASRLVGVRAGSWRTSMSAVRYAAPAASRRSTCTLGLLLACLLAGAGCAQLPPRPAVPIETAIPAIAGATSLDQRGQPPAAAPPGAPGVRLVAAGTSAARQRPAPA